MNKKTFKTDYAGKELIIETGELALQTNASCTVQYGDTMVMATVVMNNEPKEGIEFFPLMVEYQEKLYAAGKIKGSRFIKRETRPDDTAVLTGRMIDRGLRPLFDESIRRDIQVIITVLSVDGENDPDIPAIIAASTVLHISDIPWNGPLAGIRVGKIENKFVVNPTYAEREQSPLDLTLSTSLDKVLMVESDAKEVNEADYLQAFKIGLEEGKKIVNFIDKIRQEIGKEKQIINDNVKDNDLDENQKDSLAEIEKLQTECREIAKKDLEKYLFNIKTGSKKQRKETVYKIKKELDEYLIAKEIGKDRRKKILEFFDDFIDDQITDAILTKDQRIDGRKLDQIRELSCKINLLPRTHGSGLFNRGETQVLSIVTLGSPSDEQIIDTMEEDTKKRYMHHYNFLAFSVGEASPVRGTGRREVGHGALAEKALIPVLPSKEDFPYTIRVVSEVLGSNGSSSMASTCGSTLALMAAGVPIKKPVAGIAIGIASREDGSYKILTDIQDFEDGKGGMDFKITGTRDGITAVQMDTKTTGLSIDIVEGALKAGYKARLEIIDVIENTIKEPAKDLSPYAPRIITMQINPDKIKDVIGPGGKIINEIINKTGVSIDIEQTGLVMITTNDAEKGKEAKEWVDNLTKEAKVGEVYVGTVIKIMEFGAFVEIFPGTEGLVHVSEITDKERVNDVNKYLKEGMKVKVKVIKVDDTNGKISLSIKKV